MKQSIKLAAITAYVICVTGCGLNHSQYSEDIIPWVYENVIGHNAIKSSFEKQRDTVYTVSQYKYIGDSDDDYEHIAFSLLLKVLPWVDYIDDDHSLVNNVKKSLTQKTRYYRGYDLTDIEYSLMKTTYCNRDNAAYYNSLLLSDLQATADNIKNYYAPYKQYLNDYILSHVQILDQGFDTKNNGEKYTGYYAVYALTHDNGAVEYALVSITEFDDNSKYEYELVATADSLREINQYFN